VTFREKESGHLWTFDRMAGFNPREKYVLETSAFINNGQAAYPTRPAELSKATRKKERRFMA